MNQEQIAIPQAVRCAFCGNAAHYEEDAGDNDKFHCHIWICNCGWTTEWDVLDGKHEGLYYCHPDEDDSVAYWEIRHYEHAWNIVDGRVPECAIMKREVQ
jgi:hypothetical protein